MLLFNICVYEIIQAFEEHAEVLKARDAMIAALQSSLSAKDMELEVAYYSAFVVKHMYLISILPLILIHSQYQLLC